MPTLPITERDGRIAPAEYLAAERRAATRSEYVNGKAYAMAGASREHVTIVANLAYLLVGQFKGRPCMAFTNDMRVKVTETGLYTYPDVAALCSEPEFEDAEQDTLMNPSLIIEVLSDSTERYDRGDKFAHYRRLTSLQDYVLVSRHRRLVEHFARHGEEWILRMAEGLEAILPLPAMGCELPLADIYDKVSFGIEDSMTDAK